jgi:Tol biopolymer transport system component
LQTAILSVGSRLLPIGVVTLAILLSSTALFLPLPNQQSAFATFPGQNGKIAFERDAEIWVMNPDGSRQIDLNTAGDNPDWSADGTKIAFDRNGNAILIMNADGSGQRDIDCCGGIFHPSWSPDGTKIAYIIEEDICDQEIYVINADGSGKRRLTNLPPNCGGPFAPDWSPDGTKIAFSSGGIMVMNADGSGLRELTNNGGAPSWSPDGTKIAFTRETQRENQIWVINAADGSGE